MHRILGGGGEGRGGEGRGGEGRGGRGGRGGEGRGGAIAGRGLHMVYSTRTRTRTGWEEDIRYLLQDSNFQT